MSTFTVWELPESLLEQVKVTTDNDCWWWTGRINNRGYGQEGAGLAHRSTYMTLVGMIPQGMTLDHLCRHPRCVNPNHLEAVTRGDNARRVAYPPLHTFVDHPRPEPVDELAVMRRVFGFITNPPVVTDVLAQSARSRNRGGRTS